MAASNGWQGRRSLLFPAARATVVRLSRLVISLGLASVALGSSGCVFMRMAGNEPVLLNAIRKAPGRNPGRPRRGAPGWYHPMPAGYAEGLSRGSPAIVTSPPAPPSLSTALSPVSPPVRDDAPPWLESALAYCASDTAGVLQLYVAVDRTSGRIVRFELGGDAATRLDPACVAAVLVEVRLPLPVAVQLARWDVAIIVTAPVDSTRLDEQEVVTW